MANSFFEITGGTTPDTAGSAMVGLDLNNDGIDETVVGGTNITVIYGDAGGFDPAVDITDPAPAVGFTLSEATLGSEFGFVIAKATDLQGSGSGDALLIGARQAGTVSVVLNNTDSIGFTVTGLTTSANGMSLAGLGDFNGDGIGDFAIGVPDANSQQGAVYVIFGDTDMGTVDFPTISVDDLDGTNGFVIEGFDQDAFAGSTIAGGFDFDGDGANDLLIGAPGTDVGSSGGTNAGAAYIVYGTLAADPPPTAIEDISDTDFRTTAFTGLNEQDRLGTFVSAGDVNGSTGGPDDIVIFAPEADGNSSAAYVVLDGTVPPTNLGSLSGADGFKITGVDIADVTLLGDVSGDGVGDIGVVTTGGDVYVIYGSNTGFASGTFDVTNITDPNNQPNNLGIALTGLFGDLVPASVTLAPLGDVNRDPSGTIGDIGIFATFAGGTQPAQSFAVLGGTGNFAALDAADGNLNGLVDFAAITGPVPFTETTPSVTITGEAAVTIDEDTAISTASLAPTAVQRTIGITDTNNSNAQFIGASIQGVYGVFILNNAGDVWTYTIDTAQVDTINALGTGQSVRDTATFVADNTAGTRREVTITINGVDDIATVEVVLDGTATEDDGRITGTVTLNDPDASDNPTLSGASGTGTYGSIVVGENGSFTYVLTDASLQSLSGTDTRQETISLTGDDGLSYDFVLTITGAAEGVWLNFDENDNTIYTGFGNDIIYALGGQDFINAGAGDDEVYAGVGDDTVFDVLGDDIVDGGTGNDDIRLLTGDNTVEGRDGNDLIVTGFGFDTIDGGAGDDVINADQGGLFLFGNNLITGGDGNDYMMGGAGRDTFVFNQGEDVDVDGDVDTIGAFNLDLVTRTADGFDVTSAGGSFQYGVDQILLRGFTTVTADNVMDFVSTDPINGNNSRFIAEGTNILLVNLQAAPEDSTLGLQASDFLFELV